MRRPCTPATVAARATNIAVGRVVASLDERDRAARNAPQVQERFHYRYLAANLAWEGAKLLPDDSEETARVLCLAGTWLKNRDQRAADRFYKALVRRCRKTALGAEADRLRWFPPMDSEGNWPPKAGADESDDDAPRDDPEPSASPLPD